MWKPLTLANQDQSIPCLLVKCDFGSTDYTIHLTDLTYIWTESLDRKQIIRRALDLSTSIDPSENGSQLRLLLGHVERSFEGLVGTSLSLRGEDSSSKLLLNISVELPTPLAPLEWPLHMVQTSQDLLTSHFVLPCLSQVVSLRDQINSLLQHLREKDNVIRKLTDKMQSDGTELSRVFPGVASARGGSRLSAREALSKSVKGMAEFDQQEWRKYTFANSNAPDSIYELVKSVFPSDHGDVQVPSEAKDGQTHWWEHLQAGESLSTTTHSNPSTHHVKSVQNPPVRKNESSFDGFQVGSFSPFHRNRYEEDECPDSECRDNLPHHIADLKRIVTMAHGKCVKNLWRQIPSMETLLPTTARMMALSIRTGRKKVGYLNP